jgi:hypothetical protein
MHHPSTWETEAGGLRFQSSLGCEVRICLNQSRAALVKSMEHP